jgi:hypothetical protein
MGLAGPRLGGRGLGWVGGGVGQCADVAGRPRAFRRRRLSFHAVDFLPLWAGGRSNACGRRVAGVPARSARVAGWPGGARRASVGRAWPGLGGGWSGAVRGRGGSSPGVPAEVAVVPRVRLLRLWAGGRSNACGRRWLVFRPGSRRVPDMGCFSGSARVAVRPGWGSPGLGWAGVAGSVRLGFYAIAPTIVWRIWGLWPPQSFDRWLGRPRGSQEAASSSRVS